MNRLHVVWIAILIALVTTVLAQPAPPPTARPPSPPSSLPAPPAPPSPAAGIKGAVDAHLAQVRRTLANNTALPKDLRDKLTKRLDKVRGAVDKRLSKIDFSNLATMESELEKMGEDIEQAMEGLEDDLEKLGDTIGKDLAKQLGNLQFDFDDDDMIPMTPGVDIDADDDDLRDAIDDLKDLALQPAQRASIVKIRTDSDTKVAAARKQMDDLSKQLETALANSATSDADIARMVDQLSAQEAAIRKSRILAWVQARRVLDVAQRKKIEDAMKKSTK